MAVKFIVRLEEGERKSLKELASTGKTQAYRIKHANILLAVDAAGPSQSDSEVATTLG